MQSRQLSAPDLLLVPPEGELRLMGKLRRIPAAIRHHESGLTMVEVLAAMIVAALGILALAPMMVVSIQGNGHAESLTAATMKAQTLLESLKQQDPLPAIPYQNVVADTADGMTQYVEIDNHGSDAAIPTGVNRLSVTVTWTDKGGVDRSIQYSTFRVQ
jgi:Tfp pilus assembly protein PilV